MSEFSEMMKERPKTVRIIGVGRAGINVAKCWRNEMGGERADKFVAVCDWEPETLERSGVSAALKLDECKIWPGIECGAEAVEKRIDDVRELVNANDVAVVVGLGGIFGTEAAPVIAREAKAAGASTVGVATLPFEFDGTRCARRAMDGLRELAANCDAMFILNNDAMQKYYGKFLVLDALARIDRIMSDAADVLTTHCMRNEPQYKKLNAKVFGIGRAGADLVDYLREKKYRKTLLMTARVNDDSGCIKSVECNIDTGDAPTILDVFSRFFSGKDSRACLVADWGVSGIDTATTMADLAKKNGAITIGLATLPAVSEGAAICTKAIDNLQKLAVKTDAVFAFRKDVCGESVSPFLGLMIEDIEYVVNRLIKEGKNQ
ncbi:MAG: hypothetical protein J5651_08065 [Salinivirgaceae bacterium]|nr:hypothetical protein [Salinivirgaceae bacterium]